MLLCQKIFSDLGLRKFFFSSHKDSNIPRCESFELAIFVLTLILFVTFIFPLLGVLLLLVHPLLVLPLLHQVFLRQQLGVDSRVVSKTRG